MRKQNFSRPSEGRHRIFSGLPNDMVVFRAPAPSFCFSNSAETLPKAPQNSVAPFERAVKKNHLKFYRENAETEFFLLFRRAPQNFPPSSEPRVLQNSVAPFGRVWKECWNKSIVQRFSKGATELFLLFQRALQNFVAPFGRVSAEFERKNWGGEALKAFLFHLHISV